MACIFSRLSLITLFTFLVSSCSAGWTLKDDYNPSNFFSKFSFWTGPDPTHGHVNYVDQGTATANGLIKQRNGGIYMGVDYTNNAPNGRMSVRLTSNAKYNVGSLLILDIKHMPVGCGTWPAYWTVGPNWPNGGEIDIIEGVHNQDHNAMTLHTSEGCTINQNPLMTGTLATSNCYIKAPGQWDNQGCSVAAPSTNTYGKGLNQIKGGVYAVAWQKAQIRVWFFPRGAIPADISAAKPKPAGWGKPLSIFSGGCNIPQFFKDHQIVFDTTFCGDWAGNVWGQSGCQTSQYPTCQSFVSNNPGAFKNAYWQINSLKVYTQQPNTPTTTVSVPASRPPVSTTPVSVPVATPKTSTQAYVPVPTGPQDNGDQEGGGETAPAPSASSSSSMNVMVGADGKLVLRPAKREVAADADADAPETAEMDSAVHAQASVENLMPQVPILRRPNEGLEEREAPVDESPLEAGEDGEDEEVDEALLAVLAREKARKGRHQHGRRGQHVRRHVRNVGLREGVWLH